MIGLIGKKIGMTQIFDEAGVLIPVTVVKVDPNIVIKKRTQEKDGYNAVLLGAVDGKPSRFSKPFKGQFQEGLSLKKYLHEFRDFDKDLNIGDSVSVELFTGTRFVDVVGISKGKGYAGVMKRHGFGGGRETHGSKFHRENGSTGQSSTPSNTKPGLKMPGRMGHERVTTQNLSVVKVDAESDLMLIKGAVPGANDSVVLIKQAVKRK